MLFDTILVGAGPSAVAALAGLPKGRKVLVLTGEDARLPAREARALHAKIDSVSHESGEPAGIGERIRFAPPSKGELVQPAITGGLANYWGQQFARYEANDPWPRHCFASHADYLTACGEIEALFRCSPGADGSSRVTLESGYRHRTPNLVLGSAAGPQMGLRSMRDAFQTQAALHNATVLPLAARRWEAGGGFVRVVLSDGSTVSGRQVLLAAGVVGTLKLVFASCMDVSSTTFGDHAPVMLYTTLKPGALPMTRRDGEKHFNTLAIERVLQDKVTLFASVYRLSHAPLSLLLAMLRLPALVKGLNIPGIMNLITPVQVWTEATQMRYRLERGKDAVFVEGSPGTGADPEMKSFLQWLKPRAKVWKTAGFTPGGGFHYCAGRVVCGDAPEVPVDEYLRQTQQGRVHAVDSTVLPELGCCPSALTMMANSLRTVARLT